MKSKDPRALGLNNNNNNNVLPSLSSLYFIKCSKIMLIQLVLLLICLFQNVICQNDYYEEMVNAAMANGGDELLIQSPISNAINSHTKLNSLDVICGKEYMTVRAEFNGPFNGIIFSKGTYGQSKCVYVKPHSGLTHTTFNVRYDECGTKPDLQGKYFENTIVIQYGTDIIEAYDEAKRLRCEWFEAYEKPATFRPAIPVADLDIIEMNFQGDEIDCWMSIQEGKGPWSNEINRIVTVGQPLTIVVAINDKKNQFDMKVKSCFAHDGIKSPIYLIDEDGCILRPKMISPFQKIRNLKGKASLISYAQFLAFKFPDSVDVQIQCTVEVCRYGCQDTCNNEVLSSSTNNNNNHLDNDNSHHRNLQIGSNRIQMIENVTSHYHHNTHNNPPNHFVMKDDLLESADSNGNIAVKSPDDVIVDINMPGSSSPSSSSVIGALVDNGDIKDDGDVVGDGEKEPNYLDLIADYLHNVDNNNKPTEDSNLLHNDRPTQQPSMPPASINIHNLGDEHFMNNNHHQHHHVVMMEHPPQRIINNNNNNNRPMPPPIRPPPPSIPQKIHPGEPIAQVMNIPLNPIYSMPLPLTMPPLHPAIHQQQSQKPNNGGLGSLLNPFNSLKLFNKKHPYLPQVLSHYFNNQKKNYMPNDNFDFTKLNSASGGSKIFRKKRFINDKQGEIGLKKGFQVVTALDLSFSPNMSQDDQMPVFEGKPEAVVYGICFSSISFFYAISLAIVLLLGCISISVFIVYKLEKIKAKNKC